DWGAPVAWNTALLRPDRVAGVAGLSVPYSPRGDIKPLDAFRAFSGDKLFYIDYFQEPGVVEAEVETNLETWLRGFYFSASAEVDPDGPSMAFIERGGRMRDVLQQPGVGQMAWLPDDDFRFYLAEFERTGLTGGFNRYRNITRDWYELAAWRFAPITVPSLFIGGDKDGPTILGAKAIANFDANLPDVRGSHILADCGHWVQQEQPDAVNSLLIEFIAGLG
ncbi:MAG: alpha/beta hydrolase, partial [Acidimicrobiia bacterium]|nr:alpha/beta hydrolase [Acidimicrobiia bacterium]